MEKYLKEDLPACPVEMTLTIISSKWMILILRELLTGTKRFTELKNGIGSISQKVLSANLKTMEARGLLTKTIYPVVPPKTEYSLTDLGKSLQPVIRSLWDWGEMYKSRIPQ